MANNRRGHRKPVAPEGTVGLLTDQKILDIAVDRFGSKRGLAQALEVAPQTVSDWCKERKGAITRIPKFHRRWLVQNLNLTEPGTTEPWRSPVWRAERTWQKSVNQLKWLFEESNGHGKNWEAVMAVLDVVTPWDDRDWKALYDGGKS